MINHSNPYNNPSPAQDSSFLVQTNDMSELDKGWFKCYQIGLYSYLVMSAIVIYTLCASLQYVSGTRAPEGLIFMSIIVDFIPVLFIIIQLVAIRQRDLIKAKMALVGHFGFFGICLLNAFFLNYVFFETLDSGFLIRSLISAAVFGLWVLFGSIKVYQFLNAKQIENEYQGVHNA